MLDGEAKHFGASLFQQCRCAVHEMDDALWFNRLHYTDVIIGILNQILFNNTCKLRNAAVHTYI